MPQQLFQRRGRPPRRRAADGPALSAYRFIAVERDGPVTTIRFDRPERRNALHGPAHWECHDALDRFEADPDQWIAIVTGSGDRAFSAGADLKALAEDGVPALPPSGFAGLTSRFAMTKPVIAAINGLALGGGFETALACDIIVAADHAEFGLPEPRVGLAPLAGGLQRLPRAIGLARAMEIMLTARRISAREGLELGFVGRLAGPEGVIAAARSLADEMLKCSPLALRAIKQAVHAGFDQALPEAIATQLELPAVRALRSSQDAQEGPRAFVEKRAPDWKGA